MSRPYACFDNGLLDERVTVHLESGDLFIQRQIPHAHLEVIPDRGHWIHVEAPDAMLAAIDRHVLRGPSPL